MNAVPPAAEDSHARDDNPPNVEAVSLYKRREKIFVHYVGGKFQKLRLYTGWPLLLGYFLLPWLAWGERQAVLFDLPSRQFYVFGVTFWPQDFMLLAWSLIIAAIALFAITSMVGRLWCGYTCPQTVWTAVFMWIEKRTEGSRNQRMRLDKQPLSLNKLTRRSAKHLLWVGFALLTGITFVGYFYAIRSLLPDVLTFSAGFWPLAWVAFFTLATYINAGWLREQVCIYMCPYARFQSAMIDKDTLVVAYDGRRGEPRGSRKRGPKPAEIGDCINCMLCVQVCPTGIDIRDGLQYECIQCANCIDACDQVMDKMGYAKGLVRYASERSLKEGPAAKPHFFRARTIGYIGAITVMIGLFVSVLVTRIPFSIDVLRERGELFHIVNDAIRNDYTVKVVNKSQKPQTFELSVVSANKSTSISPQLSVDSRIEVSAGDVLTIPLSLTLPRAEVERNIINIELRLCEISGERCVEGETRFISPPASTARQPPDPSKSAAGDLTRSLAGNLTGNLSGVLTRSLTGGLTRSPAGNLTGNLSGVLTRSLTGGLTRSPAGGLTRNLSGVLTRSPAGGLTRNLAGGWSRNTVGAAFSRDRSLRWIPSRLKAAPTMPSDLMSLTTPRGLMPARPVFCDWRHYPDSRNVIFDSVAEQSRVQYDA